MKNDIILTKNNADAVFSMPEIMAVLEVNKTVIIRLSIDSVSFLSAFCTVLLTRNEIEIFTHLARFDMKRRKIAIYEIYNKSVKTLFKIASRRPKKDVPFSLLYSEAVELYMCLMHIPLTLNSYQDVIKSNIIYQIHSKL